MIGLPLLTVALLATAELPSAADLLARSIAHHDPNGRWETFAGDLVVDQTRPGRSSQTVKIRLDLPGRVFRYDANDGENHVVRSMDGDLTLASVNGQTEFTPDEEAEYRVSAASVASYRDYCLYMYGLPMKLLDEGTRVDPDVREEQFAGRDVWTLRVTYDAAVGEDIWYFYFDPDDARLVGCRFYHDESANDGEWIEFEGEVEGAGLRLPKARAWYVNADGRLLGTDDIQSIDPIVD